MSKLMEKLSDKLSHLGKGDKADLGPVKGGEPTHGKLSDEPQATHTEDASMPAESQAPPSTSTEEPAAATQTSTVEESAPKPVEPQPASGDDMTKDFQTPQTISTEEPAAATQTSTAEESAPKPVEPQLASGEDMKESQAPQTISTEEPAAATQTSEEPAPKSVEPQPASSEETTKESQAPQTVSTEEPAVATQTSEEPASKPVEPQPASSEETTKPAEPQAPQTGTVEVSENVAEPAPQGTDRKEVFVGSIDQGTTSSRFLIFDTAGEPVAVHQEEFKQIYNNPGWHEHDPIEIVESVERCIEEAVKTFEKDGHSKDSIKTIGITNQRETTVCWDWKTGEPLYNAIVWTDTRTAGIARELKAKDGSDKQDVCGLPISSYPSVTKLLWMLKNVDKVKEAYEAGNLAFGTIDSWLIYKLNGGTENPVFVSDPTNASRTMFMDIRTLKYSDEMLDFFSYEFDLRRVHMPEIVSSSDKTSFGKMGFGPLKGWSITGCLGDQSSALVGQKGFSPGSAKNTYGTGCFLLYNVGDKPVISKHGLLATVAYDFGGGKPVYALEGSIAVAGSGVKFLMENLGFESKSHRITELAESVEDNGGLVFVTAFSGLFAPYWIDDAQGTIFGITGHTKRGHVARATLEAVCFQTKAILDAMELDSGHKLTELKVDGGMSNSALCMQTQADLTQIPIIRPKMRETTALGAAIAAGFASEVWKSFDELHEVNTAGQTTFEANMSTKDSRAMVKRWERAVGMCKGWLAEEAEENGDEEKASVFKKEQQEAVALSETVSHETK